MVEPKKRMSSVTLEDVRIAFRNFSGVEGRFNPPGKRNFLALLPDDIANLMAEDGWKIGHLKSRDEDEEPQAFLPVAVSFANRPPRIVMITSRGKTPLDEGMVSLLDWAEILKVDLIVRPYQWDVSGKSGIKAYVQSMFITLFEDELERKYIDVPDSAANSMPAQPDFEDE